MFEDASPASKDGRSSAPSLPRSPRAVSPVAVFSLVLLILTSLACGRGREPRDEEITIRVERGSVEDEGEVGEDVADEGAADEGAAGEAAGIESSAGVSGAGGLAVSGESSREESGEGASERPRTDYTAVRTNRGPRIDGRITDGEWPRDGMEDGTIRLRSLSGLREEHRIEYAFAHDSRNLYIALRVMDEEADGRIRNRNNPATYFGDVALLYIDSDGDGEFERGEDKKIVAYLEDGSIYMDQHHVLGGEVASGGESGDDARIDGSAEMEHHDGEGDGYYDIEFSIPLDSGDDEDFSARVGDILRFQLAFADKFSIFNIRQIATGSLGGTANLEDGSRYLTLYIE